MFQTKVVQKIKTHILCSVNVFRKSCCLRDNVEKNIALWGRPQMTLWRMRNACWIPKAINPLSQYVTLTAFSLQNWLHERTAMFRYTYIACLESFCHFNRHLPCLCQVILPCGYFSNYAQFYVPRGQCSCLQLTEKLT